MNIELDHVPLKRPHFQLRDGNLFFMISKRPHVELQPGEPDLWNAIDGIATARELDKRFPDVRSILARWWRSEVIEMVPASFPSGRIKVLVIEPHMDDAVLSVGGLMWERRNTHEFIVVSLVGVSNFTSYQRIDRDYFDIATVSELRRGESELVMRVLGGSHKALGRHDAPLRYQPGHWTLDWYRRNRRSIAAFINHCPVEDEVLSCAEEIKVLLCDMDVREIWMPMGVGTSTDHETTRNACLLALMDRCVGGGQPDIFLYQDVPYAMNFPWHSAQILKALGDAGTVLTQSSVDVTAAMPSKLRLISIFSSQFKMSYMGHRVENTARMAAPRGMEFGELLVRVENIPSTIDLSELYSGRDHVRYLSSILAGWTRRHGKAKRITVLCPMGVGRWKDSMESLLRSFPDALIELHLTSDGIDETKRFSSPRIRVHPVDPRGAAWLCRIMRVLLSGSRPIVVMTGWKFQRLGRLIRTFCIPFDALPAISVGHFVLALKDAAKRADSAR